VSIADHPEVLYGVDGEPPHFVRGDLATTPQEAAAYLARLDEKPVEEYASWMNDPIDAIELIWMVPAERCPDADSEDGCENDDCELNHEEGDWYVPVEAEHGVDAAVRYWRWQ